MTSIQINAPVKVVGAIKDEPVFHGRTGTVIAIGHECEGMTCSSEYDVWVEFQGSHGRSVAAFAWDELAVADAARGAAS